jgi:hypothetical protein
MGSPGQRGMNVVGVIAATAVCAYTTVSQIVES